MSAHPALLSRFLLLSAISLTPVFAAAPAHPVVPVWPGVPPGSNGKTGDEAVRLTDEGEHIISNVHRPSLTVYLPDGPATSTAAVLVIPGGGHRELWMDHEGYNVAAWLSAHGIAAFILKYRLARHEGSTYSIAGDEVADATRAMRLIRSRAAEWKVDPQRLGILGFSAGGELAARTSQTADAGEPNASDVVARESAKPAFQALLYPGNPEIIQPTRDSPPTFLCWGFQDGPGIADGLSNAYARFRAVGVPLEMHEYSEAGHGFGLRAGDHSPAGKWIERFHEWLCSRGVLHSKTGS